MVYILRMLILLLPLTGGVWANSASWNQPNQQLEVGSTFEADCTLTEVTADDVVKLVKVNAEINSEVTIAENGELEVDFQQTGRYHAEYVHNPDLNTASVKLSLTDVQGTDSAVIHCMKVSTDPNVPIATLTLTVPMPVTGLELFYKEEGDDSVTTPIVDGATVTMVEGQYGGLSCKATVDGSLTPPDVAIDVGGTDETSLFTSDVKYCCEESPLGSWETDKVLDYYTSKPEPRLNGKTLKCTAGDREISVEMDVSYAPRIACEQEAYYADVGDSVSLVFLMDGNPLGSGGGATNLPAGITGHYSDSKIMLEIDEVMEDHFRTYVVSRETSVGTGSGNCTLERPQQWEGYDTMPQPSWDVMDPQVEKNSDLVLTCTVTKTESDDVIRITKFNAEIHLDLTVAENDQLMPPFNDTGRYAVLYSYEDQTGETTITLTYTDIQGEDSGLLTCFRISDDTYVAKTRTYLNVSAQVDDLYMFLASDYVRLDEGATITWVEGEADNGEIRCMAVVNGSLTQPSLSMSIGDVIVERGGLPITHQTGLLGPWSVTKVLRYTPPEDQLIDYNGQTLSCRAWDKTATAVINSEFSPRVNCTTTTPMASVGQSFEFSCSVLSNPTAVSELLFGDGVNGTGASLQSAQEGIGDWRDLTLSIQKVNDDHFGEYTIRANNTRGQADYQVTLDQDSGGVSIGWTSFTLIITSLATLHLGLRG